MKIFFEKDDELLCTKKQAISWPEYIPAVKRKRYSTSSEGSVGTQTQNFIL